MARPGITFAQVAQSAEALTAAGINPTIAAIRQAMGGTGSPNTIHKHLAAWKGERPQVAPGARPGGLPERLMAAIQDEINRAAASARADIEEALQQAQAETVELARAGEYLEAERDALLDQVETLKAERSQAQAVADERLAEIQRMEQRIEQEKRTTEETRQELTRVIKERQDAHQGAAVMQAKLEAAERRATEAERREAATGEKLAKCEDQERTAKAALQQSQLHTQAQQIALDAAARELEQHKGTTPKKSTEKAPGKKAPAAAPAKLL